MHKGDRVVFVAQWSTFYKMRGVVAELRPHVMVLVDGDRLPVRVHEREIVCEHEREISMTGAE